MAISGSSLASVSLPLTLGLCLVVVTSSNTAAQTRPRSLSGSNEKSVITSAAESELEIGSEEAGVEAKRLYKQGSEYGHAGLFVQAAELFQRATKLKPDYADAYRGLGHAYFDLKQWDKAVPTLEQALLLNPKDKDSRKRLEIARSMIEGQSNVGEKTSGDESPNAAPERSTALKSTTPPANIELTKVYRVGPGDVLDVRLNNAAEPSGLTVTPTGFLEHQSLSAPLSVSGLTVEEITEKLESELKKQSANASAAVVVRDYVSHAILVSGMVKEPGTKSLRREAIPLYVVVADAQPLPEAGQAVVVRNETNEVFTVDLSNPEETSLLVQPRDVITLQAAPTQFFYVSGDVKAPGEKVFRRGMTLTQAIMTAGGLTGKAGEIRLARDDGKGFLVMTRFKLKDIESGKVADPTIQAGDRITITN
jgi:polysaccharide biosynthesis/export protein